LTFIVIANWLILKIILTAHADIFFFFLLSLYFLVLIKWVESFNIKWLLLISLTGAIAIWVKYNSIILVPFLIIVSLIYGRKKFNYLSLLFPVISSIFSFYFFKKTNGVVIEHFQGDSFIEKLEKALTNFNLFYTNFCSSGRVYFSSIFSKSVELLVPQIAGFIFMLLVIYLFYRVFLISKGYKKTENIFLLFSLYYWFCFFALCQYTEWEELNSRTLFPAIVSLFLWVAISYPNIKKPAVYFINSLFFVGIAYSFIYAILLNRSDEKKFLNYLTGIGKNPIVFQLKKIQDKNIVFDKMYSNESKNLSYILNNKQVQELPAKRVFKKGKFRELNEVEYIERKHHFYEEFLKNNVAVLIFDTSKIQTIDSTVLASATQIYRFNKDMLILHIKH
jgi:hypothetical protein